MHWGPGVLDQEIDQGTWCAHTWLHAAAGGREKGCLWIHAVGKRSITDHAETVLRHLGFSYLDFMVEPHFAGTEPSHGFVSFIRC